MPSNRTLLLEKLAWATLDDYIHKNPKPRMSPRERHRAKMWLVSFIDGNFELSDEMPIVPANLTDRRVMEMINYTKQNVD